MSDYREINAVFAFVETFFQYWVYWAPVLGLVVLYVYTENLGLTLALPLLGALAVGSLQIKERVRPTSEAITIVNTWVEQTDSHWDFGNGLHLVLSPNQLTCGRSVYNVHEIDAVVAMQGTIYLTDIDGKSHRLGRYGADDEYADLAASRLHSAIFDRRRGTEADRQAMVAALDETRSVSK